MKILDITPISDTAQMPLKKGTLQFLQDAHKETLGATITGLIGNTYNASTLYVLNGCTNTGSGSVYAIAAGAVFYNGEVYLVDAANFTASSGNTAVLSQVTSQYTTFADPVTFTDSTTHNVHNIRKMQISQGASGSGISDYSSAFFLNFTIPAQVSITGTLVSGGYPNYVINNPTLTNPILAAGSAYIGDIATPYTTHTVTLGSTLANTNYVVLITPTSAASNVSDDLNTFFAVKNKTTSSFDIVARESASAVQNLSVDWVIISK